ncbi:MAG: arsenosugar biosynthesis radical SAM protein ArsS [Gammaproteobacteria bacterium]|nr:arsenosugar biosynthesis radical SAM protein ArsS [Gammaproteobacteria bacterium]
MHNTLPLLEITDFPAIHRGRLETLQVNLGYQCNQRCLHCHVNAGPTRTEMMSKENVALIVPVLKSQGITTLDLTGGAPELHPEFRALVQAARQENVNIIDRCNLTILFEPKQETLAEFLAENRVEIIASLPCYSLENVDKQRGEGVFTKSIAALKKLNALGYGKRHSGLTLNLVYNPIGPTLPPNQETLENTYKQRLFDTHGIEFNALFTLANMPIKRFGSTLVSKNEFAPYMQLLKENHSDANLGNVMCRHLISVDWLGGLYDCDFNQQLEIEIPNGPRHLRELLNKTIHDTPIRVADHCFGCTAGQGSSCGGALDE